MTMPVPEKTTILSPIEITQKAEDVGVEKSRLPLGKLILLSILAGAYIAFGAIFSAISVTGMSGVWPYGFTRVLAGVTFSVGLILVVIGGAELFTGNNLMIIAVMRKKITWGALLRNWFWVYLGNLVGSLIIALLVIGSKIYTANNGDLGKTMLTIANNKMHYSFWQAVILGILCNILVCLAVWLAYSSRSASGKILAIVFPITAFIAAGFEHSVANMYILSVGLFMEWLDPAFVAGLNLNLSSLTTQNALFLNLLPVTLGNIIGGAGFVGFLYGLIYRSEKS